MADDPKLYKSLLASSEQVQARIEELAGEVILRYKGQDPLFVCLLRGGAPFAAQMMFAITRQDPYFYPELDYMTIRTYGDERTSKPAELIMDLSPGTSAAARKVILLDDVLDKGITAEFARGVLTKTHKATEVDLVVLLQKNHKRDHFGDATLYGFESPPDWLTGMGLDDTRIALEANRWAGFVAIANDEK
jgi:hypoxanthine phosphoribosyltransferase